MSLAKRRIFYPELHADLAGYWPLEESGGTELHDISLYGEVATVTWSDIVWELDKEVAGSLLYSKHFQGFETNIQDNLLAKASVCDAQCLYCSGSRYCKACVPGLYLELGDCVSDCGDDTRYEFIPDYLERECKFIKKEGGCENPLCKTCPSNKNICIKPCIINAAFYKDNCYTTCPEKTYAENGDCLDCKDLCLKCTKDLCLECEKGYLPVGDICEVITCGNGIVNSPEECDDGNVLDGDGCSSQCLVERDFVCYTPSPYNPSICTPICGDGKMYGVKGEECDDGNLDLKDGCDSNCKVEPGWWCTGQPLGTSKCYCTPYYLNNEDVYSEEYNRLTFRFSKVLKKYDDSKDLCTTLFGDSAKLFGIDSKCCIIEDTIVIDLGEGSKLEENTILSTVPGVIDSEDCVEEYKDNSARELLVPTIPAQTVNGDLVIEEPVVYCEEVVFWIKNVLGDLSRPFKELSITVLSMSKDDSEHRQSVNYKLTKLEKEGNNYYVMLDEDTLLGDTEYTFKLNVTNFQGISYVENETRLVHSQNVLRASLDGAIEDETIVVLESSEVIVRVIPTILSCTGSQHDYFDVEVVYEEVPQELGLELQLAQYVSGRLLRFPAGTLKAGSTHQFKVTASFISNPSMFITKKFGIHVQESPVQAVVSPQMQIISINKGFFTLSSEGSLDRTLANQLLADNSDAALDYSWSCKHLDSVMCTGETKELSCGISALVLDSAQAELVCQLVVASAHKLSAPATATVLVTSIEDLAVLLHVAGELVGDKEVVLVYLSGELTGFQFAWEVVNCESYVSKVDHCGEYLMENSTREFVKVDVSKMQLTSNSFEMKLSISDGSKTTSISFTIKIKETPSGGDFLVAPTVGTAWETEFRLEAKDFRISAGELTYEFVYLNPETFEYSPLAMVTSQTKVVVNLPVGTANNESRLEVGVRVYSHDDAWVVKTRVIISKKEEDGLTPVERFEKLLEKVDLLNPSEIIKQVVAGSLTLTRKVDAEEIGSMEGKECNNHGILVGNECLCHDGYQKRLDCSLSDAELAEEAALAKVLLAKLSEVSETEPSPLKDKIIAQAVANIAKNSDLLDSEDRILARNLLQSSVSQGTPVDTKDLAKAISSVLVLSEDSEAAENEFAQVVGLIDVCLEQTLKNSPKAEVELRTENFNARAIMTYPLPGAAEQVDILGFPHMLQLLHNVPDYIVINIVEYKSPVYAWATNCSLMKSSVISVNIRCSNGTLIPFNNLSIPINITFGIDMDLHTSEELTNMRCMSYNGSKFVAEGTSIPDIDVDRNAVICSTTHLTDFVLMTPEEGQYVFNVSNPSYDVSHNFSDKRRLYLSPLFWFTIALTIVFSYLLLWGHCKEKSEAELLMLVKSRNYDMQQRVFCDGAMRNRKAINEISEQTEKPLHFEETENQTIEEYKEEQKSKEEVTHEQPAIGEERASMEEEQISIKDQGSLEERVSAEEPGSMEQQVSMEEANGEEVVLEGHMVQEEELMGYTGNTMVVEEDAAMFRGNTEMIEEKDYSDRDEEMVEYSNENVEENMEMHQNIIEDEKDMEPVYRLEGSVEEKESFSGEHSPSYDIVAAPAENPTSTGRQKVKRKYKKYIRSQRTTDPENTLTLETQDAISGTHTVKTSQPPPESNLTTRGFPELLFVASSI